MALDYATAVTIHGSLMKRHRTLPRWALTQWTRRNFDARLLADRPTCQRESGLQASRCFLRCMAIERLVGQAWRDLRYGSRSKRLTCLASGVESTTQAALARMRAWVSANGLTLHPGKTHVGDCRLEGHGFEFLGYRLEAGLRLVRKKSLMALRDKVRAQTPRNRGGSIESVIASLGAKPRSFDSMVVYGVGPGSNDRF